MPQIRSASRDEVFTWRHGRSDVTLRREDETWSIVCTTIGRLLGPRQILYANRHRQAELAVWDVMARVIRLTHDEEQGLRAGCDAARWIREMGYADQSVDRLLH